MKSRTCQELFLFAGLMFVLGNPVWGDQTSAIDTSLAQLENRFFEHPYKQDTETDRLSRLEGFIFGGAQQGSVQERLKHILATIPSEPDKSQSDPSNSTASTAHQPASSGAANTDLGSLPNGSTYPRVTSLEQELLGRTFAGEALASRLARLESKAYGSVSTSSDLSQRVDQLDQYAERHDLYGERRTASSSQPNTAGSYAPSNSAGQTQFSGSISERLAMMESQEFGRTYPERSLDKRVKKLGEKVFPKDEKHLAGKPLPDQVNALWLTLHPNGNNGSVPLLGSSPATNRATDSYSYDPNSAQEQSTYADSNNGASTATANNRPHHGWLHALAKTAGTVGKIAASSMSSYGSYPGYGYGGGGFGGYGGGYGGYGSGYGGGYGSGSYFGAPSYYGNTLPNHY
jgi:hypothetical protein